MSNAPSSMIGRNSVPRRGTSASAPTTSTPPATSTATRWPSVQRSAGTVHAADRVQHRALASSPACSSARHSTGITKIDRSSDESSASATVKASGENIFPSSPCSVTIGTKVSAMISSPRMLGLPHLHRRRQHGRQPVAAPCRRSRPSRRWTFSTWMIVASMIMPIEMARPPSDIRFASMPRHAQHREGQQDRQRQRQDDDERAAHAAQQQQQHGERPGRTLRASAFSTVRVLASTIGDRR